MTRLLTTLLLLLTGLTAACGLSERERTVSEANQAIDAVFHASRDVAHRVGDIQDDAASPDAFRPLILAVERYLGRVEALNAALRAVSETIPELQGHLEGEFLPAAEQAIGACEDAMRTLNQERAATDDYQRAVARVGLCMERYAAAVTRMAQAYQRAQR
mgnify:CR=1 FL=1